MVVQEIQTEASCIFQTGISSICTHANLANPMMAARMNSEYHGLCKAMHAEVDQEDVWGIIIEA